MKKTWSTVIHPLLSKGNPKLKEINIPNAKEISPKLFKNAQISLNSKELESSLHYLHRLLQPITLFKNNQ
jgi:hypothetical protein